MTTDALQKAHETMRAKREAGEKVERLDPLEKARRNPASKALALRAKCFDCMGGDSEPGVRKKVRECSVTRCPLHPHRPWQTKTAGEDDASTSGAEPDGEDD